MTYDFSARDLDLYFHSKGRSNVEAVDERQQLESLTREEKTLARTVATIQTKYDEAVAKKGKLQTDNTTNGEKKAELESKLTQLQSELASTRAELDKQQREYFLQQQMKAIRDELGGENVAEVKEMQKKGETKKWPDAAADIFKKGTEKLERMHPSTPDYSVVYNHLDLMLDLPWEEYTTDSYDLRKAKKVLDHDHYGMNKIKERILLNSWVLIDLERTS